MTISSAPFSTGYDQAFSQSRAQLQPAPTSGDPSAAPTPASTPSEPFFSSPYPHVPDRVYGAFMQVAQASEPWVADDMKHRLFEQAAQQNSLENDWIERARLLREASSQAQSRENIQEAIRIQNLQLAGRGQPAMQPAEERALAMRMEAMSRSRAAFLDSFASALSGDPLEAVA
jgi:hypothetical protein